MKIRGFLALPLLVAMSLVIPVAEGTADKGSATEMLAFVRRGDIWVSDITGKTEHRLTDTGSCGGPALSPDGQQVAFHCRGEKDIFPGTGFGQTYLAETGAGEPHRLHFKGILAAEHPAFSPDGKSLIFVGLSELKKREENGYTEVFATMSISIAAIKTGEVRDVLRHPDTMLDAGYIYSNPVFSPDGQLILWQHSGSDVSGGFSIMNLQGKPLFHFPRENENSTPYWQPNLSRDGRKILCYSPATSDSLDDTIYFINRTSGTKTTVTKGAKPVFINNETALVFERWENRWSDTASPDLWLLEMAAASSPRKILVGAEQPATIRSDK